MAERHRLRRTARVGALLAVALVAAPLAAQVLYKYPGPDGEWVYADRPPDDGAVEEVRPLDAAVNTGKVTVQAETNGAALRFVAANPLHAPVELVLRFTRLEGYEFPDPDRPLKWVLAPTSREQILELPKLGDGSVPAVRYVFDYRFGDPAATHQPGGPYRVPFALSTRFPVTQAYPDVVTHTTEDSRHAIDIAMPIGTNVFAARGGTVFDVSANHYRNGLDPERDGPAANVVQILHDDGTYAVYAHLNWNTIRVRRGERVTEGQYIADSGNTGFSSGAHLHFVVLRNSGQETVSVPVLFRGAERASIAPATGSLLTAY